MAFDTKKDYKFPDTGSETSDWINARRGLRESIRSKVESAIPSSSTRGLSLDQKSVYADAVVDSIVSKIKPADSEKPIETKNDQPGFNPLEERWKSWFQKAGIQNPESFVKRIEGDRDFYLNNYPIPTEFQGRTKDPKGI